MEVPNVGSKGHMRRLKRLGRNAVLPGLLLAWTLLAPHSSAVALNPSLEVSQYAHTSRTRAYSLRRRLRRAGSNHTLKIIV